MYERSGHHRLVAHALRLGFPNPLVRVAIRAYRLPRVLSHNGVCALGAWPTSCVIAGRTLASTFAKVAVIEGGDQWVLAHPGCTLGIYVDDIAMEAERGER